MGEQVKLSKEEFRRRFLRDMRKRKEKEREKINKAKKQEAEYKGYITEHHNRRKRALKHTRR